MAPLSTEMELEKNKVPTCFWGNFGKQVKATAKFDTLLQTVCEHSTIKL
jgi:hypothetical protein